MVLDEERTLMITMKKAVPVIVMMVMTMKVRRLIEI